MELERGKSWELLEQVELQLGYGSLTDHHNNFVVGALPDSCWSCTLRMAAAAGGHRDYVRRTQVAAVAASKDFVPHTQAGAVVVGYEGCKQTAVVAACRDYTQIVVAAAVTCEGRRR